MLNIRGALLAALIVILMNVPCRADLLDGTQISGSLQIATSGNLYVPATQTLGLGTITTFAFSIPTVNNISTQFNIAAAGDTLTLTDQVLTGQPGYGWTQTFTDSAFVNFNPVLVSSSLAGLQFSQTGTTMTFSWAGSATATQPTTFSAVFNLVDPPSGPPYAAPTTDEPPGVMLPAIGIAIIGLTLLRRKSVLGRRTTSNP